ncbi:MAG: NAD(P)-binding protein [bacterium]|nr:NAD(P)-binding protein [bacterium]
MAKYDVAVIGAGAAGLAAAGLLAKEGKSVVLLEKTSILGGRGLQVDDEGFRVSLGGHMMEDPGSGIVKIANELGFDIERGPLSSDMAVWDHNTEKWGSIRDRYTGANRDELKRVIKKIVETPYEDFDEWDDRPLRTWLAQYTSDEGVMDVFEYVTVLECMTDNWYDHSASDSLYVRKLHLQDAQKTGFSFWPVGGWDRMWANFEAAITNNGGVIRMNTPVTRVVIENDHVKGVMVPVDGLLPNTDLQEEFIEAAAVISTLPVWYALDIFDPGTLPLWYENQIRYLAQDKFRVSLLGIHLATEEPVPILDRLELSTWLHSPRARVPGFLFEQTAMDPATAPDGVYLYSMGGVIPGAKGRDHVYLRETMDAFHADVEDMYPGFGDAVWSRRSLIFDPPFGVIQMPMLVGSFRPDWKAPNVDGLWFASETFKSRMIGTDRAARAALTCVEDYLGRRLWSMDDGWRY